MSNPWERLVPSGVAKTLSALSMQEIRSCQVSDLIETYGIPPRAAERVGAIIELGRAIHTEPLVRGQTFRTASDVFRAFSTRMRDLKVEQFWAVLLDGKHRVMREVMVSQGTLTSSPVHPREVFTQAVRWSAAAIVLVHNHPSGDPNPSADDLEITRRLRDVGNLVGVRIVDHVVIGDGTFCSLADRGLL